MSQHRYMTSLLLVTVSYFPKSSSSVLKLASTVSFINAISVYISHLDASVRRCGMLAAEVVAHLCDKKLDFGDWDGDGFGKPWCRSIRSLLESRDVDAPLEMEDDEKEQGETHEEEEPDREELKEANNNPDRHESQQEKERPSQSRLIYNVSADYDSDDSMTGYASPPSSRSASPSPSELAAIEKDPTLNVGLKKVPRPMYLAQLGDLFRGGSSKVGPDDPHEADRIEMALNTAEELIRRKKGFGTELDENAVNLVFALLGLQDNFDLEGFAEKRQGALNALVACSPRKAAPALIQEFFKNQYSADQRFVALNALAIGARELASLPVPASRVPVERTAFPSKRLPEPLHRKYITANTDLVLLMVDDLSKKALEPQQAEASTSDATQFVRERRLRIGKTSQSQRVIEVLPHSLNPLSSDLSSSAQQSTQRTSFIDVAAEYFIMPLISSFWSFLRDEQAREERTAHREGRSRYQGTGTGLILNPLVLAQFVRTLAILVNASVHAPEWLSVIAPEALELAITIGTRPMSITNDDDDEGDRQSTEASLLTSTLELALVVLDGALNIDGGRILGLEYTTLVLGVEEWAGKIFKDIERGLKLEGGGGAHEIKLSRAAAGVLLKIDELTSKWRRSMLDTR
ncbi:hypothetical protein D9613_002794 [Agrocybe pediades]|uniref:Telomere length regulation protein conserved domain-containing protein n=1 Tax=Agrocybe pediades TaxID=84607 RepID=A0A8H4VP66_9AGAR|nr:hypothetical protein D9613_002794 [Agrocybe pediades]